MPLFQSSLLDTRSLSVDQLQSLFRQADHLKKLKAQSGDFAAATQGRPQLIACVFFEPSTRTRLSFEMAAYRLGYHMAVMDSASGSSRSKGETLVDTVLNVAAMKPDLLLIRYGDSVELDQLLPKLSLPVISAGNGVTSHPSQALLDAYTIAALRGRIGDTLHGERVLIVGDIRHSRVASSNFDVLTKLGAEVAVCGPKALLLNAGERPGVRTFQNVDEGVEWCTVYMGLRIQLERHVQDALDRKPNDEYHQQFGLGPIRMQKLAKDAIILHPGPINHGVEFSPEVLTDPRCHVLTQVENGVLIRAALLSMILNDPESVG